MAAPVRRSGQSTVELVILVGSVTAALVAMGIYLQRGYQGYLRNTSQGHGTQFDPDSPFIESRKMNAYLRNQTVDVTSAEASVPSLGGSIPGRMLTTKVSTSTEWDVTRSASHEAN